MNIIDLLMGMGMSYADAAEAAQNPATGAALSGAPLGQVQLSDEGRASLESLSKQQEADRLAAHQREQAAAEREDATNAQFGNDMAWLDPLFQQGATTIKPSTTADALQFGLSADPRAAAEQANLLGEIRQRGNTADPEAEAAQQAAVDELMGLYRQGGLGAQERAARARARADSENWLQGQRQADIQDRAERGMAGSGGEILDLLADRQAAGSRMSAADLETDAAAEKRALEALLGAQDVAKGMRDASDRYQDANTRAASDLATGMRRDADSYVGANADRLNDASDINSRLINDASSASKKFLQDAYLDTMKRRDAWDRGVLDLQTRVATDTRANDATENAAGWDQGKSLAVGDTGRRTDAGANFNNAGIGMWTGTTPSVLSAQGQRNDAAAAEAGAIGRGGVSAGQTFVSALAGGATGGGGQGAFLGGGGQQAVQSLGGSGQKQQSLDPWERYQ